MKTQYAAWCESTSNGLAIGSLHAALMPVSGGIGTADTLRQVRKLYALPGASTVGSIPTPAHIERGDIIDYHGTLAGSGSDEKMLKGTTWHTAHANY